MNVAVEVKLMDGQRDVVVCFDVGSTHDAAAPGAHQGWRVGRELQSDAQWCMVRFDATGGVTHVAVADARVLTVGDLHLEMHDDRAFIELRLDPTRASVIAGSPASVKRLTRAGAPVELG